MHWCPDGAGWTVMVAARDWAGQRVGALVAVERGPNCHLKRAQWHCNCDCGTRVLVKANQLTMRTVTSCGCGIYRREAKIKDLIGQRFGNLTVVARADVQRLGRSTNWSCKCDCGGTRTSSAETLKRGK